MSLRKNVSISLSPELHAVAGRMLASGRYGNFSEVVRAGLRLLDEREIGLACRDTQDVSSQTPRATHACYRARTTLGA